MPKTNDENDNDGESVDPKEVTEAGTIFSVGPLGNLKPVKCGPDGKHWSRVGFIVDSGASNSTLPPGTLPNHDFGPATGYKEHCMADGRVVSYKDSEVGFPVWESHEWKFFSCGDEQAIVECGQAHRACALGPHGSKWWIHPFEGWIQSQDLFEEWCLEVAHDERGL